MKTHRPMFFFHTRCSYERYPRRASPGVRKLLPNATRSMIRTTKCNCISAPRGRRYGHTDRQSRPVTRRIFTRFPLYIVIPSRDPRDGAGGEGAPHAPTAFPSRARAPPPLDQRPRRARRRRPRPPPSASRTSWPHGLHLRLGQVLHPRLDEAQTMGTPPASARMGATVWFTTNTPTLAAKARRSSRWPPMREKYVAEPPTRARRACRRCCRRTCSRWSPPSPWLLELFHAAQHRLNRRYSASMAA